MVVGTYYGMNPHRFNLYLKTKMVVCDFSHIWNLMHNSFDGWDFAMLWQCSIWKQCYAYSTSGCSAKGIASPWL